MEPATVESTVESAQWICKVCDWVYDEAAGDPGHGIAAGTPFASLPEDWHCPECGVGKADFERLEF